MVSQCVNRGRWRCHKLQVSILNKNQRRRRAADSAADEPGGLDSLCERGRTRSNNKTLFECTMTGPSPHLQSEKNTTHIPDLRRHVSSPHERFPHGFSRMICPGQSASFHAPSEGTGSPTGLVFCAPGSLARRRPARVIHHHQALATSTAWAGLCLIHHNHHVPIPSQDGPRKKEVPLGVWLKSTRRSHTRGFYKLLQKVRLPEIKNSAKNATVEVNVVPHGDGGALGLNGPLHGVKDG